MSGVVGMKLRNPPRKGPPPRYCSVEGCEGSHVARGLCGMHYERTVRRGKPLGPSTLQVKPKGSGHVRRDGYVEVWRRGHPLAGDRRPRMLLHRGVLFDAIGYGPHPCHWCGKAIRFRKIHGGADWLVVDHIDHNPTNNELGNLVPSCTRCNTMRHGRVFA